MKRILDVLTTHKHAIIWTVCYVAFMWGILEFLFHFDMFSTVHWHHLRHAHLRGFPGLVFGILILAALPLYIATTTLITRTKKPLFAVPTPKIAKAVWTHMQPTLINPPAPEQSAPTPEPEPAPAINPLPAELPAELRTAYINSRTKRAPEQYSAFNRPMTVAGTDMSHITTPDPAPELDTIPLPSDFDIIPDVQTDIFPDNLSQMSAPTFTDITFDTPDDKAPTQSNAISEYFDSIGRTYDTTDDIIITDKHAIALHTDPDFWVCDNESWFATGKQKPSPIKQLADIANGRNLNPILYLGADNIMDLDTLRQTWESMGILIITDPTQIPE